MSPRNNDSLQASSRSKAVHLPGKTLCNPLKDLRDAGFVDAMHQNTDDETMMDPPGQTWQLITFRRCTMYLCSLDDGLSQVTFIQLINRL